MLKQTKPSKPTNCFLDSTVWLILSIVSCHGTQGSNKQDIMLDMTVSVGLSVSQAVLSPAEVHFS